MRTASKARHECRGGRHLHDLCSTICGYSVRLNTLMWCLIGMVGRTERPLARANAHWSAGRIPEAAGAYRAVLSIDVDEVRAHVGLAECAVAQGRVDAAIDGLVAGAQGYATRDRCSAAFALLTKALAIAPDRMELHIDVAELEAASGRTEMAAQRLENLARAYAAAGAHDDAALVLEAAAGFRVPAPPPVPSSVRPAFIAPAGVPAGPKKPRPAPAVRASPPPLRSPAPTPRLGPGLAAARETPPAPTRVPSSPPAPKKAKRARRSRATAALRWRPSTVALPASAPSPAPKPAPGAAKTSAAPPPRPAKTSATRGPARARVSACPPAPGAQAPAGPAPRVRVSIAPPPRPEKGSGSKNKRPARPSIAPAPSPARGGKRLDKLPPLRVRGGLGKPAARARRSPVVRPLQLADEDATTLWCPEMMS